MRTKLPCFQTVIVPMLALALAGCSSYTQSKVELTAQAQQGVARVRDALASRQPREDVAAGNLRERLDAAFDQDVLARAQLSAEWVIEHRKAYAAAIDAFDAGRGDADGRADVAMAATLDAVWLLLSQLQQMHATELRLTIPEVNP